MNTAPAWLPGMEPMWFRVDKFDERAIALVDGLLPDGRVKPPHYSRQTPGSDQIAPPGETCLLLGGDGFSVWVACHNFEPGETDTKRWRCTVFRRELGPRASDMIRVATAFTYDYWRRTYAWPSVPLETEINIAATARRRGKRNPPGYSFICAGWKPIENARAAARGMAVLRAPEPT